MPDPKSKRVVAAVAAEVTKQLYGHLPSGERREKKKGLRRAILRGKGKKGRFNIKSAVAALSQHGNHQYDLEGDPVHGVDATRPIGSIQRGPHAIEHNEQDFNRAIATAVGKRLGKKRNTNESYSNERLNIILETVSRILDSI